MNAETLARVRESYTRNNGNLNLVARELGISADECRRAFPQSAVSVREVDDPQPGKDQHGRPNVGRKAMRDHIVSVRHALAPWPEADRSTIVRARRKYDAGTHYMATGRDGNWIILYSWKRRKAVPPRSYFYGAFA